MLPLSRTRDVVASFLFLALLLPLAQAQTTFSNTSGITIDSATATKAVPYPSLITVSGLTSTTTKVTVTLLGLTHGDPSELRFLLEEPTGRRLMIFSDVSNGISVTNIQVTLDDAAAAYLPYYSGALTGGTFKPTSNGGPRDIPSICTGCPLAGPAGANTFATTFNGLNPNGNWKLYVYDWVTGLGGSLTGWEITITTSAGLATTTAVASSLNPSWTTGAVTLTATVKEGANAVTQGTVTFLEGTTTLAGPVALNASGQASSGALALAEGAHVITAQYNGAGGYSPSTGQIVQVVNTPTTQSGNKFCNAGTITIPKPPGTGTAGGDPANPYPSNIFVSGLSGTTSKVTVDFTGFGHAYPANVDMILVSPAGDRSLLLWSDAGSGTSVSGLNMTLDDGAATLLPDNSSTLAAGTYKPTARDNGTRTHSFPNPAPQTPSLAAPRGTETLALFNGIDPNGNWKLYVVDGAMGGTGSITGGWCVTFTLSSDAPTTTAVTSSPNPSFTGDSVTFTATVTSGGSPVMTGTVTFTEGSTVLQGPVGLDGSGQATFTTSSLGEGAHRITASYSGVPGSYNVSAGYVDQQIDDVTQVNGTQFCNTADTGAMTIPAPGTAAGPAAQYPLRFFVSNLPGTVNTVTVSMNGLEYSSPGALQMMLAGPAGTAAQSLDFFSHASNTTPVSGIDLTFSDAAAAAVPGTTLVSGTYLPTSTTAGNTWDAPAPAGPYQFAAPAGPHTLTSVFGNIDPTGVWSLYVASRMNGTSGAITGPVCLTFTQNAPDLSISKAHAGDFRQGAIGAQYTITVTNNGPGSSGGTVTVTDTLPASLTATAMSGTGWACDLGTLTCTRADALPAGASHPPVTVTVNVADAAPASVTNTAAVFGGGDATPANNTASDAATVIAAADLTIAKSHAGDFSQGQTGASYTITVTNSGAGATVAPVTVVENPPAALVLTGLSGAGWTCDVPGRSCTRSHVLGAGGSYPAIIATFNVAADAPSSVSNGVAVSGGGQLNTANDSAADLTTIIRKPDLTIAKSHVGDFRQGQAGAEYTITVTNSGGSPTSGAVTVTDTLPAGLTATAIGGTGWACNLGALECTRSDALASGASYPAIVVTVNVTANAPATVTNSAAVSGGGEVITTNNTAADTTLIGRIADLRVAKSHTGHFRQRQAGAAYSIVVTNAGTAPTAGTVTVADTLPAGLMATAMRGAGWTCSLATLACTRSDALAAGASYPAVTLTVSVAANAPAWLVNTVVVSGGGEAVTTNNTASDPTRIDQVVEITVKTAPPGLRIRVDDADYPDGQCFEWISGSSHRLGPGTLEEPPGTRRVLVSWSDAGAATHTVTAPAEATTYTATFGLEYALTTAASPPEGGSVTPAFEWCAEGATVAVSAAAKPGFAFAGWTGPVKDLRLPATQVLMSAPVAVTANFVRPTGEHTIAFPPIPDKALGDPPFAVTATASSGLPVAFRIVSGPARIEGSTVTLLGLGEVSVEASQSGDETHAPAVPVTQSFGVLEVAPVWSRGTTVDAASYRPLISPAGLASIFGHNLAFEEACATSLPLPLSLAGTWVTLVDSAGRAYSAPLLYVSPMQVNLLVPESVAEGTAQIFITNSMGETATADAEIAQTAPALFSIDMTGRGLAAANFTRVAADGSSVTLPVFELAEDGRIVAAPIDPGGPEERVYISLFGTGIRRTSSLAHVTATAGGLPAAVQYAGPQPEFAGLDQVNIELPKALAGRGAVEVSVTVQGRASNSVSVVIQ